MNCSCDPSTGFLCPEGEQLRQAYQLAYRRAQIAHGENEALNRAEAQAWDTFRLHSTTSRTKGTGKRRERPAAVTRGETYICRRFDADDRETWFIAQLEQTGKTKRFVYLSARPE